MKQPPSIIAPEESFELPRRIQSNQELLDLITRNNSFLIRFVCSDNVHHPDLEVLAQMKMNQMKVDSIAKTQNQMVDYLLTRGVERHYGNGHNKNPDDDAATLSLPAPAPLPVSGKVRGARCRILFDYASQHGGELRLSQFRADYMDRDRKFATTGVYPVAHTLMKAGLIERVGEGVYRIVTQAQGLPKRGRPKKNTTVAAQESSEQSPYVKGRVAMLDWANAHGGEIVLPEFGRAYVEGGGSPAFTRSGMYMAALNYQKAGKMEKVGPGYYRLVSAAANDKPDDRPDETRTEEEVQPQGDNSTPDLPLWTGGGGREAVIYWASYHQGIFRVADFRPWWAASETDSPTFAQSTVFSTLKQLENEGLAKKIGKGEYRIYLGKARKALGAGA